MKELTKFKCGDEVWLMAERRPFQAMVVGVYYSSQSTCASSPPTVSVTYRLKVNHPHSGVMDLGQSQVFATKRELAEHIGLSEPENETARKLNELRSGVLTVATECNCRWEHGASGAEHLRAIEAMLKKLLQ